MITKPYIQSLGPANLPSPMGLNPDGRPSGIRFIGDELRIPYILERDGVGEPQGQILFERAGPRQKIYFDPANVRAAIVTCGGLAPGLNNVIRAICLQLQYHYGVHEVYGIRYGYHGMNPATPHKPIRLTPELVSDIHETGGTILGTSRGPEEPGVMLNFLRERGINILFPIGGDGTQKGALAIYEEARRQNYPLAVVGVPKTIDNDVMFVYRTFGFFSAVDKACSVLDVAHTEARAVFNGVGLVRLMGRDSGFITAGAAVASGEVNLALIPEVPFDLDGDNGVLAWLERRLVTKTHAVIAVAEGAGQELIARESVERDASGNLKLADIGPYLRQRIHSHFAARKIPVNVRYIDPSYIIRGIRPTSEDALLCERLGRDAVHAAMAGKTGLVVGMIHETLIHVPSEMICTGRKKVNPEGFLWQAVLDSTGQPRCLRNS